MVIRKYHEDQNKTLAVGLLFSPNFPGCGHDSMSE